MQNVPVPEPALTEVIVGDEVAVENIPSPEDRATAWVNRLTLIVGAVFLMLALGAWYFRQHHYRLVLALLVVALFASIIHSYTFNNGE
jgi:hypothetical protein